MIELIISVGIIFGFVWVGGIMMWLATTDDTDDDEAE